MTVSESSGKKFIPNGIEMRELLLTGTEVFLFPSNSIAMKRGTDGMRGTACNEEAGSNLFEFIITCFLVCQFK